MSNSTPMEPAQPAEQLDEDTLITRLAGLESEPLSNRVRILTEVHEQLSAALTELDHL